MASRDVWCFQLCNAWCQRVQLSCNLVPTNQSPSKQYHSPHVSPSMFNMLNSSYTIYIDVSRHERIQLYLPHTYFWSSLSETQARDCRMYFLLRALGVCPTTFSTTGKLSCQTVLTLDGFIVCYRIIVDCQRSKRHWLTEESGRTEGSGQAKRKKFFPKRVVEVNILLTVHIYIFCGFGSII